MTKKSFWVLKKLTQRWNHEIEKVMKVVETVVGHYNSPLETRVILRSGSVVPLTQSTFCNYFK